MISASSAFLTANAVLQKKPIYLIEIATYTRAFTNRSTGVSGQVDWITAIEDHSITVNDLDGGADLGEFVFSVQDRSGLITADFPGFVFEGKAVTCKTGFVGMSQADFVLLFTGKIDSVASANGNTEYTFTCVDNKDVLSKVIYLTADDGRPTDSNHTLTVSGHPLAILQDILLNEIGLTSSDFNSGTLGIYAQGLFAGMQFAFIIDSPPAARDFIENQLLKPLGGYIWVNNKGQLDFTFFRRDNRHPVNGGCCIAAFTDSSGVIVGSPFLCDAQLGAPVTVPVPAGATLISFGLNDHYYTDNAGSWTLQIDSGPTFSVGALNRPWDIGLNPRYTFSTTGSTASTTRAVTAGTIITISYINAMTTLGPGWPFTDPAGVPGAILPNPDLPAKYTVSLSSSITAPDFSFTNDTLQNIPEAQQADLINTVSFRFDKDSQGKFQSESINEYTVSVARYGQYGQQVIEADGLLASLQGFYIASFTAQMIFLRYGLKNLMFTDLSALWNAVLIEPGDLVALTSSFIPDRAAGVIGITSKLFEVLDRKWNFNQGIVTLRLIDASYLLNVGQYLIAPDGISNFTAATAYQKGRYMFLSNDSDQYSDATPGHALG